MSAASASNPDMIVKSKAATAHMYVCIAKPEQWGLMLLRRLPYL